MSQATASTESHPPLSPIRRLLRLLSPERRDIVMVIAFSIGVGVLTLATPVAVQALVNIVSFGGLTQPLVVLGVLLLGFLTLAGTIRASKAHTVELLQRRVFVRVVTDLGYRLPRVHVASFDRGHGPELARRMELLDLELKLAADAVKIDLARNQALPLFVLDFQYGILDRQGSFGTAWQGMWDFDNNELAVGLRGEIPVTNAAREALLRRALLTRTQRLGTRAQRLGTRAQRDLAIRPEVYDALDILEQNWPRILAARQNVVVSGVNYEAELKQFREGLRTMREVLEVLTQLGDAQIREVQALVAYQVAQIDLAYATGTLLGYAGMEFSPIGLRLDVP